MFAVLKTGGKQYKVAVDDTFAVEKLAAAPGETVQFNDVLMLGGDTPTVGAPLIAGAAVQAEVLDQFKGPKTISFKKRRRKHSSQRKRGHRQPLTMVRITEILTSGGDKTGIKAATGKGAIPDAAPAADKPKAAKAKPKAEKPAAEPQAATATTATTAAPDNLLKAPKGDADDLKKITGVGPKLENTLNEVGVYHFWQIAAWGPEDVAHMDDLLSFKGRIDRDGWIDQAKAFAAETE
ncbi:MAG: 50S ribosomal protein L21 [Pseudomonadota bacterium]